MCVKIKRCAKLSYLGVRENLRARKLRVLILIFIMF